MASVGTSSRVSNLPFAESPADLRGSRIMRPTLTCLLLATLGLTPALGIINTTVPLGNTVAPTGTAGEPTDPGFDYVGRVNGSTGVYLGNGWVLTANHVGAGTFFLDGSSYAFNGVDSHQIGGADLRLFRLSSDPGLPLLKIATSNPSIGDEVVMIGSGRSPTSASTTTWFVDTDPATWVWSTSDFPEADAVAAGYVTGAPGTKRWGTNLVEGIGTISYSGYTGMSAFSTDFDQTGGTAFEAHAVTNDSGSGVFIQNGSDWELAGTIVVVTTFPGQPGGAANAIFGNLTYAVNLAAYATEINSYVPEPRSTGWFLGAVAFSTVLRRRYGRGQRRS